MGLKASVLVVEDDGDALEAIVDTLACEGYATFGAGGGEEALDVLARIPPPSVILCDVMMPGMNGAELGAKIANDLGLADVPILFFSAARGADRVVGCPVLRKPFSPETLLFALEREIGDRN
jgi:CheY-like chemotaxis protein